MKLKHLKYFLIIGSLGVVAMFVYLGFQAYGIRYELGFIILCAVVFAIPTALEIRETWREWKNKKKGE